MPKYLVRYVAWILTACLIADPNTGFALGAPFSRRSTMASSLTLRNPDRFSQEAFANRAAEGWSIWNHLHAPLMQAQSRLLRPVRKVVGWMNWTPRGWPAFVPEPGVFVLLGAVAMTGHWTASMFGAIGMAVMPPKASFTKKQFKYYFEAVTRVSGGVLMGEQVWPLWRKFGPKTHEGFCIENLFSGFVQRLGTQWVESHLESAIVLCAKLAQGIDQLKYINGIYHLVLDTYVEVLKDASSEQVLGLADELLTLARHEPQVIEAVREASYASFGKVHETLRGKEKRLIQLTQAAAMLPPLTRHPSRWIQVEAGVLLPQVRDAHHALSAEIADIKRQERLMREERETREQRAAWKKRTEKRLERLIKQADVTLGQQDQPIESSLGHVSSVGQMTAGMGLRLVQTHQTRQILVPPDYHIELDEALIWEHRDAYDQALAFITAHERAHIARESMSRRARFTLESPGFDPEPFTALASEDALQAIAEEIIVDRLGYAIAERAFTPAVSAQTAMLQFMSLCIDYTHTERGANAVGQTRLLHMARFEAELQDWSQEMDLRWLSLRIQSLVSESLDKKDRSVYQNLVQAYRILWRGTSVTFHRASRIRQTKSRPSDARSWNAFGPLRGEAEDRLILPGLTQEENAKARQALAEELSLPSDPMKVLQGSLNVGQDSPETLAQQIGDVFKRQGLGEHELALYLLAKLGWHSDFATVWNLALGEGIPQRPAHEFARAVSYNFNQRWVVMGFRILVAMPDVPPDFLIGRAIWIISEAAKWGKYSHRDEGYRQAMKVLPRFGMTPETQATWELFFTDRVPKPIMVEALAAASGMDDMDIPFLARQCLSMMRNIGLYEIEVVPAWTWQQPALKVLMRWGNDAAMDSVWDNLFGKDTRGDKSRLIRAMQAASSFSETPVDFLKLLHSDTDWSMPFLLKLSSLISWAYRNAGRGEGETPALKILTDYLSANARGEHAQPLWKGLMDVMNKPRSEDPWLAGDALTALAAAPELPITFIVEAIEATCKRWLPSPYAYDAVTAALIGLGWHASVAMAWRLLLLEFIPAGREMFENHVVAECLEMAVTALGTLDGVPTPFLVQRFMAMFYGDLWKEYEQLARGRLRGMISVGTRKTWVDSAALWEGLLEASMAFNSPQIRTRVHHVLARIPGVPVAIVERSLSYEIEAAWEEFKQNRFEVSRAIECVQEMDSLVPLLHDHAAELKPELRSRLADLLTRLGPIVGSRADGILLSAQNAGILTAPEVNRMMLLATRTLNRRSMLPEGSIGSVMYRVLGYTAYGTFPELATPPLYPVRVMWSNPFLPNGNYERERYSEFPPEGAEGFHDMRLTDDKGASVDIVGFLGRLAPEATQPELIEPQGRKDEHIGFNRAETEQVYVLNGAFYRRKVKRVRRPDGTIVHVAFLGFARTLSLAYYEYVESGGVFVDCINSYWLDDAVTREKMAFGNADTESLSTAFRHASRDAREHLAEMREILKHPEWIPGFDPARHLGHQLLDEEHMEQSMAMFRRELTYLRDTREFQPLFNRFIQPHLTTGLSIQHASWDELSPLVQALPPLIDALTSEGQFDKAFDLYQIFPLDRLSEIYLLPQAQQTFTEEGLRWIAAYFEKRFKLPFNASKLETMNGLEILRELSGGLTVASAWPGLLGDLSKLISYNAVVWLQMASEAVSIGNVPLGENSHVANVRHYPIFERLSASVGMPHAAVTLENTQPFIFIKIASEASNAFGLQGREYYLSQGAKVREVLETAGFHGDLARLRVSVNTRETTLDSLVHDGEILVVTLDPSFQLSEPRNLRIAS